MKREFITNLLPEIQKEALDAIMAENGKDVETAKAKYSDYDTVKAQLTEANKTIEDFKGKDVDGIQKAADEWKEKYEKSEKDHAAKLADIEFNGLLDTAITTAKGKNAKALRGLLSDQMDALKASKNQSEDIKAALEALKTSDGYLFDDALTPPPYAGGTGTAPIKKTTSQMTYSELDAYMKANPGVQI